MKLSIKTISWEKKLIAVTLPKRSGSANVNYVLQDTKEIALAKQIQYFEVYQSTVKFT